MTGVQTCALPICFPVTIGAQIDRNSVAGVANAANLVTGDSTWRIVMYLDTQCNQAVAPIDEVFEMTTSNEHPIDSFNNLNTEGRFKILWDKFINLRANQNAHLVSAVYRDWERSD